MPSPEPAHRGHRRHNPNGRTSSAYTNPSGVKPMAHRPVPPAPKPELELMPSFTSYIEAVDDVPETQGYGVALISDRGSQILRSPHPGGNTVLIETATRQPRTPPDYGTEKERHEELWNMVTSCGGLTLSAIGAGISYAAEPVTGGLDTPAAVWLTATTAASAGQCSSSAYRWYRITHGRNDILKARDQSAFYVWAGRVGDAIGLVDGFKSVRELWHAKSLLRDANINFRDALNGKMSRQMRAQTAKLWELGHEAADRAIRVTADEIHIVTKSKLVNGINGAYSYVTSSASGLLHEITVWVIESKENHEKNNK